MYGKGFRDLQNYTTLKRLGILDLYLASFRDLQNYTTLKRNMDIQK